MEIIIHRVNSVKRLKKIDKKFGIEIDLRSKNNRIILSHDPYKSGDKFEDYLKFYNHGTLVLNIKETGIENDVLKLVRKNKIKNYFLLDIENPYLFKCLKNNEKSVALRFSSHEPIEMANLFKKKINWLWIDTYKKFKITKFHANILKNFKLCLVSPEFWNKKKHFDYYIKMFKKNNLKCNSIMMSYKMALKYSNKI